MSACKPWFWNSYSLFPLFLGYLFYWVSVICWPWPCQYYCWIVVRLRFYEGCLQWRWIRWMAPYRWWDSVLVCNLSCCKGISRFTFCEISFYCFCLSELHNALLISALQKKPVCLLGKKNKFIFPHWFFRQSLFKMFSRRGSCGCDSFCFCSIFFSFGKSEPPTDFTIFTVFSVWLVMHVSTLG